MVMTPALLFEDGSPGSGRPFDVGTHVELVMLIVHGQAVDCTNYLLHIPFIACVNHYGIFRKEAVVVIAAFIVQQQPCVLIARNCFRQR